MKRVEFFIVIKDGGKVAVSKRKGYLDVDTQIVYHQEGERGLWFATDYQTGYSLFRFPNYKVCRTRKDCVKHITESGVLDLVYKIRKRGIKGVPYSYLVNELERMARAYKLEQGIMKFKRRKLLNVKRRV